MGSLYTYKRVWTDQETGTRNEEDGATSSEVAPVFLAPNGACLLILKERLMDPKYLAW
jgi:hypothetical protein